VLHEFPNLDAAERGLWAECWIEGVEVKEKEVVAVLTPPLSSLGFLTTSPAPRGRRPETPMLRIVVGFCLGSRRNADGADARPADRRYALAPDPATEPSRSPCLDSGQALKDLALAPKRFPARRPATVRSSSTSGR
jgi:hypothetical protein